MIRIREILDPELRRKVLEKLTERPRHVGGGHFRNGFELDDADFVDLLNDLKQTDSDIDPNDDDPRM